MDQRQEKTIEWLGQIEQFAMEQGMPLRIQDQIRECGREAGKEVPDWETVSRNIEELLESIAGKMDAEISETVFSEKDSSGVSVEEVKNYVRQMAERGRNENSESVEAAGNRKDLIIKECYAKIRDISVVKAHVKELENDKSYDHFFEAIKNEYEQEFVGLGRQLVEDVERNCENMMEHIRSMFQNTGGRKIGIGNKEFYSVYDENKDVVDRRFLQEVENADFHGEEILAFSKKTQSGIQRIKNKNRRKKNLFAVLPIFILLGIILLGIITISKRISDTIEKTTDIVKEVPGSEQGEYSVQEIVDLVQQYRELGEEAEENVTLLAKIAGLGGSFFFGAGCIFIFFIIAYILYIMFLGKKMKLRILDECGAYLRVSCEQFEADSPLGDDGQLAKMAEEYEEEYIHILEKVFSGSRLDPLNQENQKKAAFCRLSGEWDHIKRL